MPATLKSRLPMIAAELRPRVSAAVEESAEAIAVQAKARAPDAPPQGEGLVESIHVERIGGAEYAVVAGDDDVFYAHFVEFGTASHGKFGGPLPAQPFLIPAAELEALPTAARVTAVLRTL